MNDDDDDSNRQELDQIFWLIFNFFVLVFSSSSFGSNYRLNIKWKYLIANKSTLQER